MADPITPIVQAVTPYLVEPIKRELRYLFDYRSNVEDLIKKLEELGFLIGRVEQSIQAATNNAYDIQPELKTWQNSVNEIIKKAGKLFDEEEKEKKRCFNGLPCNLKSRYQLSKKAKKTAAAILLTIQAGEKFDKSDNVSFPVPPQGIGSTPIKGYEAFESRMSTLNEVMEALKDPIMSMIGVSGMGGVGKTMLVTELARKVKEDKLFDQVVMAVVSQTPNVRKIQEDIAYPLGLIFDDMEIDSQRKDRLCRRLESEKSILVILDDIWEKLDLEMVGIPSGDDHKGCKIVVTSRNQDTLSDDMGAQKNFLVNVLSDPEAWNLFKKITGDIVEAHELKPTAIEIAQECAGLPIAIAAVANALKKKSLPIWKDALRQLKSSTPTNIKGMHTKVYSTLELSYNFLQSEEQKSLFLLCSLLPEDYTFSTLDFLKFGKGLGLFQDISTLEESRDRVHTLVYQLKSSCLLLESDHPKLVKMHDVIRDVGISVASKDKHMLLVRNEVELEQCLTEERLRNCPAISLPYSKIHELPPGLKCPELKLLLLLSNDRSLTIPDTFFEGMKQLKVLDLTNICFSTLPSSLNFLSNLQTLCLDKCEQRDIGSIGELKKLEVLSFASSDIEELPREIGELTRLKLLDLSDCYKLKVIPSNVIASLSQLEDLYMKSSFVEWEIDGNVSLGELKHLSHLVTLDIHIQDANILPKDLCFEKLMRYRIFVGDVWDWYGVYETSRTLKLKLNTSIQQFGINMLLERTEDLYLDELNGLKSILYSLNEEGFPHLKHLHAQKSCEIEYIINTMERVPNRAFPNLESLFLYDLINLKEICHGQLPVESFCNLRRVEVQYCDSLKDLFSLSMARSLLQLQELKIDECQSMDEIVAEGGEGSEGNNEGMNEIMFPQLRSLTLHFFCQCS